ncbi:MAG: hypothetical protein ACFFDT_26315, partial [Candidatus Hodarchaeota archaeon]
GFHNGTYVHLAFQYSDLTKSNDSYPDGVMLIMDIDGSKLDIKSITYYGDSELYVARDQNQDQSRRAPPSNDAQNDINGTGTYSSNEHMFEMVFPLDSNDLGGNDAVLTTGDYFSCMFAVADNYNQGADYTTQFTLAFDNPPPRPPQLNANKLDLAPILDGTIDVGEYDVSEENVTLSACCGSSVGDTIEVTTYTGFYDHDLYFAFRWTDSNTTALAGEQDGIMFSIDNHDIKIATTGDGTNFQGMDMYDTGSNPEPDTSQDLEMTAAFDTGVYTVEMKLPLDSGDTNDTIITPSSTYNFFLALFDNSAEGPQYGYGDNEEYLLVLEDTTLPELPLKVAFLSSLSLFGIIIVFYQRNNKK